MRAASEVDTDGGPRGASIRAVGLRPHGTSWCAAISLGLPHDAGAGRQRVGSLGEAHEVDAGPPATRLGERDRVPAGSQRAHVMKPDQSPPDVEDLEAAHCGARERELDREAIPGRIGRDGGERKHPFARHRDRCLAIELLDPSLADAYALPCALATEIIRQDRMQARSVVLDERGARAASAGGIPGRTG
jgi:hypothetical protein